jgi:RNA polymerase sigma-70 factor (ECF subfamily)
MLRLAERYGDRPAGELPLLMQRILQNAIRDHFRRSKVRLTWVTLLSSLSPGRSGEADADPLETLAPAGRPGEEAPPEERLERAQLIEIIEKEISRLPDMGCSEGSVKTHCSRAAHALAAALRARGVTL